VIHPAIKTRTVTEFPHRVSEIENAWIELADGCRLAARIWLRGGADASPVPAILEYLPYRKRDRTAERDGLMHHYFAGHGFASVRVDMRGSGDSDGLMYDEYLQQEQDDALEVIAWLARQPWCSGAVGMIGISWGGFNSLQIAARRPPALKAIITVASTDDRYNDDVHYMGGCLLTDNLRWGSTLFAYLVRPPDPALVGTRWRSMWLQRLSALRLVQAEWLRHQRRDAFWRHGSVCENYADIQCAVYAVGGWIDGYTNSIPRLLQHLSAPKKGLIGPWAHYYPMIGIPGPQIGFLQEALRWWNKWLNGIENGIMDEPMLRAWMQDSYRPAPLHHEIAGRWIAEAAWPPPGCSPHRFWLTEGGLAPAAGAERGVRVATVETVGLLSGIWCPHDAYPDESSDQREEDAKSVVFDTAPLSERMEILGAPVIELEIAADKPNAKLAARLCDVHEDGASTRVTYGVLNLTHRDSHAEPAPLEPGRRYRVRLQLNDTAYAFPQGHRIRLALSTTYWPVTWPSPEPVSLTVFAGGATLTFPVRAPHAGDAKLAPFPPPEVGPAMARTVVRASTGARSISRDIMTGEFVSIVDDDYGRTRIEATGIEQENTRYAEYHIIESDPLSATMETRWTIGIGRGDWQTRTVTRVVMTSTKDSFRIRAELDAYEGEDRIISRNWDETVPRDLA
jgi:putative CocE/NonD family hydrolase